MMLMAMLMPILLMLMARCVWFILTHCYICNDPDEGCEQENDDFYF